MSGWANQRTEIGVIEFRRSLLNIGGVGHSKRLIIGAMSVLCRLHRIIINSNLCRSMGAVLTVRQARVLFAQALESLAPLVARQAQHGKYVLPHMHRFKTKMFS